MDESGVPRFEVNSWYGLCAPTGTPNAVVDKVRDDLVSVLRTADVQQKLRELVVEAAPSTREEFAQFIRAEIQRWARVIKDAGIPVQ